MQCKDIPDADILNYLYELQGQWTSLWCGHFKGKEDKEHPPGSGRLIGYVNDVYYAMPEGTPEKLALAKMKQLHKRGLVGGCPCGCRGDFEITDRGIEFIGKKRFKPYNGYGEISGSQGFLKIEKRA